MISVIVSTYNRRALIQRCLQSLLAQTERDFELIIVDDGSTDDTETFVRQAFPDPRIRYEKLPRNMGVHMARNRGLDLARGEYLMLWDSDDDLDADALQVMKRLLDEHKDIGMVSAPLRINETAELTGFEQEEPGIIPYEDLLCGRGIRGKKVGTNLFRRSAIGDTRFVVRHLDFIFYRRVMKRTNLYYYPRPLGTYRLSPDDRSSLHVLRKIPNPKLSIVRAEHLDRFLDDFGADFEKFCPCRITGYAYGAALGLLLAAERRRAWRRTLQGLRHEPWSPRFLVLAGLCWVPFSPFILREVFYAAGAGMRFLKKIT